MRTRAIVLAMLVAACGGSTASPSSGLPAFTSPSPTVVVPAPPTESLAPPTASDEDLVAAAAKSYLASADKVNAATNALHERYKNAQTLPKLQDYCVALARAYRTFDEAMLAMDVPDDVADAVDELVRSDAAAGANLQSCAVAESVDDWEANWTRFRELLDEAHEAANLVRLRLGLEPVAN